MYQQYYPHASTSSAATSNALFNWEENANDVHSYFFDDYADLMESALAEDWNQGEDAGPAGRPSTHTEAEAHTSDYAMEAGDQYDQPQYGYREHDSENATEASEGSDDEQSANFQNVVVVAPSPAPQLPIVTAADWLRRSERLEQKLKSTAKKHVVPSSNAVAGPSNLKAVKKKTSSRVPKRTPPVAAARRGRSKKLAEVQNAQKNPRRREGLGGAPSSINDGDAANAATLKPVNASSTYLCRYDGCESHHPRTTFGAHISAHILSCHSLSSGHNKTGVSASCRWSGCGLPLTSSALKKHILTHLGSELRVCCPAEGCGKTYSGVSSSGVVQHIRDKHRENQRELIDLFHRLRRSAQ